MREAGRSEGSACLVVAGVLRASIHEPRGGRTKSSNPIFDIACEQDLVRWAPFRCFYLTTKATNFCPPLFWPISATCLLTYLLTRTHTHSHRHTCFLACLLTSDPSQGSRGHVNQTKGPKAAISTFVQRGYEHDRNATRMLRKCAKHPNFRNCILVFRHR